EVIEATAGWKACPTFSASVKDDAPMSMQSGLPEPRRLASLSPAEQIRYAREIIRLEGQALVNLAARLSDEFCRAVDCLYRCRTSVIVTGIGKAGLVGQKIAATLASTGTR